MIRQLSFRTAMAQALFLIFLGAISCNKEISQDSVLSTPSNPTKPQRPKLPIEYLTERNVAASGKAFVETDVWSECGYFSYQEAMKIDIPGYHLPTPQEMNGILPIPHREQHKTNPNGYPKVYVGVPKEFNAAPPMLIRDAQEEIQVGDERLTCTSIYGIVGAYTNRRISYALRFWDEGECKYYSAFRYEVQPINPGSRFDDQLTAYRLQIRVRYLGKDSPIRPTAGDMELICTEKFWAQNAEDDVIRYLTNCGFIFDPSSPKRYPSPLGKVGRYWLRQSQDESLSRYRYVEVTTNATGMDGHDLFSKLPVRLFSDK